MKTFLLAYGCALVAILLTVALLGYLFYRLAQRYFDNQQKMQLLQMRTDSHTEATRILTPLRLQAYERMALLLERISPESLVLRCYQPGMETHRLQAVMTQTIRDEWDHNLSQQVYLSSTLWKQMRQAKEEMIALINSAAITLPTEADPARLASAIFASAASGPLPTQSALEALKEEAQNL